MHRQSRDSKSAVAGLVSLRPTVSLLSMLVHRASDAANGNSRRRQRVDVVLLKLLRLGFVPWCLALQFAGGVLLHTAATIWVETAVVECDSLLGYRLAVEPRPRRHVDAAVAGAAKSAQASAARESRL